MYKKVTEFHYCSFLIPMTVYMRHLLVLSVKAISEILYIVAGNKFLAVGHT
jgi:hypothetical protein